MTYGLSTPESHREVHGIASATVAPEKTVLRLRAIERAAQAVVDACKRKLTFPYDAQYSNEAIGYCLVCDCISPVHTNACPVAELERLLRGAP